MGVLCQYFSITVIKCVLKWGQHWDQAAAKKPGTCASEVNEMGHIWWQQDRPQLAYTTALSQLPWFSSFSLFISLDVSFSPKRLFKIAFAIGSIIAVEAVLLNHMDRKDVVNIIPKISLEERKKEKLNFFSLASSLIYIIAIGRTLMCRDKAKLSKKNFCDYPVTGWSTNMGLNQMSLLVLRWPLSKGKQLNKLNKLEKRGCGQPPGMGDTRITAHQGRAASQAPVVHVPHGDPPAPVVTWLAGLPPTWGPGAQSCGVNSTPQWPRPWLNHWGRGNWCLKNIVGKLC